MHTHMFIVWGIYTIVNSQTIKYKPHVFNYRIIRIQIMLNATQSVEHASNKRRTLKTQSLD